jgi:hypothetical protein
MHTKLAYVRLTDNKLICNRREVVLPKPLEILLRGKGPNSSISVKIEIIKYKEDEPNNY